MKTTEFNEGLVTGNANRPLGAYLVEHGLARRLSDTFNFMAYKMRWGDRAV